MMTREEAIKILNLYDVNFDEYTAEEIADAIGMAIEALLIDIVHCKECKHYGNLYDGTCEHPAAELGDMLATEPTDFCSYGERREDGEA